MTGSDLSEVGVAALVLGSDPLTRELSPHRTQRVRFLAFDGHF